MGGVYACLIDAGYDPAYLYECTILDLDLFMRQTNQLRAKKGWEPG